MESAYSVIHELDGTWVVRRRDTDGHDTVFASFVSLEAALGALRALDTLRCSTCEWWTYLQLFGSEQGPSNQGTCELAKTNSGLPVYPESTAVANDMESYSASLETLASHGCTQWEAREG